MKDKNYDKDKWISKARCPYERVFSKVHNRSRYRGIAKNQFQVFMESLAFNFKRMLKLEIEPLIFSLGFATVSFEVFYDTGIIDFVALEN